MTWGGLQLFQVEVGGEERCGIVGQRAFLIAVSIVPAGRQAGSSHPVTQWPPPARPSVRSCFLWSWPWVPFKWHRLCMLWAKGELFTLQCKKDESLQKYHFMLGYVGARPCILCFMKFTYATWKKINDPKIWITEYLCVYSYAYMYEIHKWTCNTFHHLYL